MPVPPDQRDPPDLRAFDRAMNEKVYRYGSRHDQPCPSCGRVGYRRVADSELVALFACRFCGHQEEELHEPGPPVPPPFREYREGRGLQALVEEGADDESEPDGP